ncbi:Hsp70 family protein [Actinomycetospora lutea]|uniref:Hsp70 family protein n=1 Tax=Actinomycetospora lutea TaxID=663604 RepID=UPI002366A796|nr:Hsp70 family protein [Actinomycetospora lutea]MDD7938313.1 Hsp70 family protein [Actinomycetospora lutea]
MEYGLGVDLGTTFTAAAVERHGRVEMVTLGDRSAAVPSVVLIRDDGTILVGDAADRRAVTEPDRVAREVKRRLGDPMPLVLGGSPYAATQLMGLQLRDVVKLVSEREGGAPDVVTLTHPANWGPYKRELFSQIPKIAGLGRVRMLTEPEGAAAHYASNERLEEGALVAVYDLGGGTFDATVLRKAGRGFEILGTPEGLEGLGGIDFDEAVFSHVDRSLGGPLSALDPSDPHDTSAVIRLREDCVRAKEALSADTETTIPVMLPDLQTEVRLTRGEFEEMIRPSIRATIETLNRTLLSAGVTPDHLDTVLLVGGSSRIPLVSQMVSAELGRPTAVDAHPKHAIVLGAAVMSGRGFVDDGGTFTGPRSGAAPVTTTMDRSDPRTGAGPTGPRDAMHPPTGPVPIGRSAPARPMVPPVRPAGPGTSVPSPALATSAQTVAGGRRRAVTIPRRRLIAVWAAAVVLVLVVAGFALVVLVGPPAAASETTLEPVNTAQANPFLPQAGGTDAPGVASPPDAAGSVGGNTPGLFGGSGSNACRRDEMADFLAGHPDLGAAWAQAQGIDPSQIGDFLAHLSPVVLRADTAVTNYGYADGHLTSRAAILQSGTAVLVDGYGTPRVKCYCGNPLTAPPRDLSLRFEGTAWPTFAQSNIVVVQPAAVLVDELTVVDVATNTTYVIVPPPWRYGYAPATSPVRGSGTSSTETTTAPPTSTTTTSTTDAATTTAPTTTAPTTSSASPRSTATSPARSSSRTPGSSPTADATRGEAGADEAGRSPGP